MSTIRYNNLWNLWTSLSGLCLLPRSMHCLFLLCMCQRNGLIGSFLLGPRDLAHNIPHTNYKLFIFPWSRPKQGWRRRNLINRLVLIIIILTLIYVHISLIMTTLSPNLGTLSPNMDIPCLVTLPLNSDPICLNSFITLNPISSIFPTRGECDEICRLVAIYSAMLYEDFVGTKEIISSKKGYI